MRIRKAIISVLMMAFASLGVVTLTGTTPVSAHGDACSWAPDSGPVWDFHNSCHGHDHCYATKPYGRSEAGRKHCDDDFHASMRASCRSRYGSLDLRRYACYRVALEYYSWVRAFGWLFW
jgi:Prokaryotic phospholipase A2